ncbi:hypothetical protein K2X33_05285 [bacterium]|nr:hypothetical protein [bacterium]
MESRFTVSAPTRVDLAGGTLDLWPLFCLTQGAKTINLALDLFAESRFETRRSDKFEVEVTSAQGVSHVFHNPPTVEECRRLDPGLRFPVAVLASYLAYRKEFPPLKVKVSWKTSVPMGSGLGGSSSLGVTLLRGISRLFNDHSEMGWQWGLSHAIRDIEAGFLEVPTGTQDYLAALFGGLNCFQSRVGEIVQTQYRPALTQEIADRMVVLFSGEQHHSGRSNWEVYKGAVEKDKGVLQGLFAIKDVSEALDLELRSTDPAWARIGQLLTQEWKIRKELFGVSTPRLDTLLASLAKKNVLGAKVCGAAAGGSILVLTEPERRASLISEMEKAGVQVLKTQPALRGVSVS